MKDQSFDPRPAHLEGLIAAARQQVEHMKSPTGPPQDLIRGYQLIREIHRGGQGVVYLAHQPRRDVMWRSRSYAMVPLREPAIALGSSARFRCWHRCNIRTSWRSTTVVVHREISILSWTTFPVGHSTNGPMPYGPTRKAPRLSAVP